MSRHFCLDIGGSFIKLAIGEDGALHDVDSVPTPSGYGPFLDRVADLLLSADLTPEDRVGVSIAGSIDAHTAAIRAAQLPFLAQVQFAPDLAAELTRQMDAPLAAPIAMENDADCFALAEAHFGAGRGADNVFAIILGTGVGGAQVYRGMLLRGFGGTAGEWGHGPFVQKQDMSVPGAVPQFACACGQIGCINSVGGARGMEALHAANGHAFLNSRSIVEGWSAGDPACSRTIASYVSIVSDALALTVNITGAEIVPVGGGLSNAKALLEALQSEVQRKILLPRPEPFIVKGETGHNGGLLGIHAHMLGLETGT